MEKKGERGRERRREGYSDIDSPVVTGKISVTPAEEKEALDNLGGLPFTSNPFDPSDVSEQKPKSSESLEELSSGPVIPLAKIAGPPGSKVKSHLNSINVYRLLEMILL